MNVVWQVASQNKLFIGVVRRGGVWIIVAKVVGLFSTLVGNILLARILTPEDLGVYYLIFSLINFMNFAAPLGLNRAVVKLLSEGLALGNYANTRQTLRRILFIGDASVLIFSVGLLVFRYTSLGNVILSSIPVGRVVLLGVISAFFMTTSSLRGEAFLGMKNYRDAVLHRTMLQNLFFISGVTIMWLSETHVALDTVLLWLVVSTLLDYLISSFKIWRWEGQTKKIESSVPVKSATSWRDILDISLPLWGTTVLMFIFAQFPLWYLDWWKAVVDVALFGVALTVVRVFFRFPTAFVNSLVPPLIAGEYAAGNKKRIERLVRLGASFGFWSTFFGVIIFVVGGKWFLARFFGSFYSQAYTYVLILAIGELINSWGGAIGQVLMMTVYQKNIMSITLGTVGLGLCLGYLGVHIKGGIGIAWAVSLTLALYNVFMVIFLYRREKMKSYALLPSMHLFFQNKRNI